MAKKRIKDLSTTITAFRTGDVIPVDGPSGTAKMGKDDLLRLTAENTLLAVIDDFSSSKSYSPGDIVLYDGNVRMFTKEHSESAYDASKTINVSLENIEAFKASNSAKILKWYPLFGFETETGFRFDPWGNVIEASDFSISDYVEITQGKKYRLHTKGSMFGNQTPIVFYDAEKNKLSYTSAPSETRVFEFTAPSDARYVRFSSNDLAATVYNDYFIEYLDDVTFQNSTQIISAIAADSKGSTRFPDNFIKGYYTDAWGNPVRNDDFDISQFIEVEGGCYYTLDFGDNVMFANNQAISFFTQELKRISTIRPSTSVSKITINTPDDCKFIQYSRWNRNPIKDSITKESDSTLILDDSFDQINVIPFANVFFVAEKPVTFYAESMVDSVVHGSVFVKNMYSSGNKFNRRNAVVLDTYEVICRFGLFDSHGRISDKCFFLNARKVDASAKSGETINVLMIGDSLSDYSRITRPLTSLFADDVANINIIGTKVYDGVKNEGRSGWSSYDYCHSESYNGYSNPFLVEGSFNIPAYLQNNNLSTPDVFIIELGTNDTWRPMGETTTKINIEEMIASARQANESCKVIILTPCFPYAGIDDASETAVLDSKKAMFTKTKEMYSDFWDRESDGIYIVNMGGTYDPIYSYNRTAVSVNDTEVIYKCTDNIHPSHIGYEQIAKSIYAAIKYV